MKRILIADDSSLVRHLIAILLQKQAGFEVCGEAGDGLEAVEKAQQLKPDLVILDLAMPRMNGVEAASVLRRGPSTLTKRRMLRRTKRNDFTCEPSPQRAAGPTFLRFVSRRNGR